MCEMVLSVQHGQTIALVMGVCNHSCYLSGVKLSLEIEHKIKGEFKEKRSVVKVFISFSLLKTKLVFRMFLNVQMPVAHNALVFVSVERPDSESVSLYNCVWIAESVQMGL